MSRYIDADAMDKRRIDYIVDGYAESVADMTEWGMALIEAPTIDIVRCHECKYFHESKDPDNPWSLCGGRTVRSIYVEPNDFCSGGRRKE